MEKIKLENNLRKIRQSKGFSLTKFAKIAKISHTQVCFLENGKRKLTIEKAIILAPYLQCSVADIVGHKVLDLINRGE